MSETTAAIEQVFRAEYGLVLSGLIKTLRDIDLAEDALSEAMATALAAWPRRGVPDNPAAWLTTTARRKAIDRIRRGKTLERKTSELTVLLRLESEFEQPRDDGSIPDERLRLIFTCCHPVLALEAQVALTLKTIGGLEVDEIASAFMVSESTMYQRLVRAKRRIRDEMVPYEVPGASELPDRVAAVLAVIYLIFTEGYSSHHGATLVRADLAAEALRLGSLLSALMPDEPETLGLEALMRLHHARADTRIDGHGDLVLLEDQDRSRWNRPEIDTAARLVERALRMGRPGPYQIQAAIAAVHTEAGTFEQTDWKQIAALYGELGRHLPTPVVAMNHAVAVGLWRGAAAGLALLDRIVGLEGDHLYHAARGRFLVELGRTTAAAEAYRQAQATAVNPVELRHLQRRLAELV